MDYIFVLFDFFYIKKKVWRDALSVALSLNFESFSCFLCSLCTFSAFFLEKKNCQQLFICLYLDFWGVVEESNNNVALAGGWRGWWPLLRSPISLF